MSLLNCWDQVQSGKHILLISSSYGNKRKGFLLCHLQPLNIIYPPENFLFLLNFYISRWSCTAPHQLPEAQDHLPDRGHRVGRGAGRREERPARDRGPAPRQRHLRPAVGQDNPRPLQRHQLHLQQQQVKSVFNVWIFVGLVLALA